jgi:hypothetical protein
LREPGASELIDRARRKAESRKTTLNSEFRIWLAKYTEDSNPTANNIESLLDRMTYFSAGPRPGREELNTR